MPQTYTYSLSSDFPGGQINSQALEIAIKESSIATPLSFIGTSGDVISIVFTATLSAGDKTTLDGNLSHPAGGLIASTTTAPFIDTNTRYGILAYLSGANLATTSDQSLFITTNRYIIRRITVGKPSQAILSAAGGIYTGAGKTGNAIVAATQSYTGLSGTTKYIDLTLAGFIANTVQTKQQLYFSLTTPEGVAGTCNIAIWGDDYNGIA